MEIRRHRADQPWTYAELDRRQREIALRVREGGVGALLLSELAPVITRGRRTPASDLLIAPAELRARGVALLEVGRGGLATYHGPGQWVLFAVDRLERLTGDRRGVRRAVEGLLNIALTVSRHYVRDTEIRQGAELGVWGPQGKLAAVGVEIQNGVLLHGLSLNVLETPLSFQGIRPCGLAPRLQFLLENGEGDDVQFEAVGERLVQAAHARFWPEIGGFLPVDEVSPVRLRTSLPISDGP